MLASVNRLRANTDFSRVYKFGRKAASANLRLFFLPQGRKATRVGIVVSKKSAKVGSAAGKVADRNRLKRIMREETRKTIPGLPQGMDIVVQAREGIIALPTEQIRAEVRDLFYKAGLLNNSKLETQNAK